MKEEEGKMIDHGSTAEHIWIEEIEDVQNVYDDMHVYVLVLSLIWEMDYLQEGPPSRTNEARIFTSLPEDKIFERDEVITWNWCLSNSRAVAISEKVKACKLSAIIIWLASKID